MTYETHNASIETKPNYSLTSHARNFNMPQSNYTSDSTALYQSSRDKYKQVSNSAREIATTGDYKQSRTIQEVSNFFAKMTNIN